DVDVGGRAGRELNLQVAHVVHVVLDAGAPPGAHHHRVLPEHVHQHRDVVWGEVPEDVDVTLEQPQVESGGVAVVDVPQVARLHQAPELPDGGVVDEGVAGHEHAPLP